MIPYFPVVIYGFTLCCHDFLWSLDMTVNTIIGVKGKSFLIFYSDYEVFHYLCQVDNQQINI